MSDALYLTHYLKQSCGWIKIAEHACETIEQADRVEAEIRSAHPADVVRFDRREAK